MLWLYAGINLLVIIYGCSLILEYFSRSGNLESRIDTSSEAADRAAREAEREHAQSQQAQERIASLQRSLLEQRARIGELHFDIQAERSRRKRLQKTLFTQKSRLGRRRVD